jgi:hypothetical protein
MSLGKDSVRNWLFPVDIQNMDKYLECHWYETTYTSFTINNDNVDWYVTSVGDKVFLEVNDDPDYFTNLGMQPKAMTWRSILDSFRALCYNNELYYVWGCSDYVPENIFTARGNYLYPHETTMIAVMLFADEYLKGKMVCKTVDIDGQECLLIGNNTHDLIPWFDQSDKHIVFAHLPLGILASQYQHAWCDGCLYDLYQTLAVTKSSLENMTDDLRKRVFNKKEEDNGI